MGDNNDNRDKVLSVDLTDPINDDWIRSARLLKKAEAGDKKAQKEWAALEAEAEEWVQRKDATAKNYNAGHDKTGDA